MTKKNSVSFSKKATGKANGISLEKYYTAKNAAEMLGISTKHFLTGSFSINAVEHAPDKPNGEVMYSFKVLNQ